MTESILQRIAARDPAAMQECTRRYGALIWSLARRYVPSAADAEDAVQDIFVELWRSAARFDPAVAPETTFVALIARRRLIDRQRRNKRSPKFEHLVEPATLPERDSVDMVEVCDQAERVSAVLATLRREQREILELALLQGRSQREIAEQKQLPLGTVKSLARRGLIKVRAVLRAQGDFEEVES